MAAGETPPGTRGGDATATGAYAHADFPPGTILAGRFRVEAILGIGGMGVVYRATDMDLGVPVALKLLRPELVHRPDAFDRFRQELLLARQVSNPHVVRIHDLARHGDQWLISMDYVEGESLDRRLDREGPFPVDDALRIVRQLAQGLAAAHAKSVIHRDLKPANILLDRDGNAYISDFGVARSLATSGLTQPGAIVGTPDYLSPEQARGDPLDARSDLYALGLILFEMLTGKQPFSGGTVTEALAQRMVRTPQHVTLLRPDLPTWVARLVDRLLRPQPAHRLQDAAAVIAAIDQREVPRDWRGALSRRGTRWELGAVLALAAVVGLGGWWWNNRDAGQDVAATQPLQRLLVLPIQLPGEAGPASSDPAVTDARLAGLGAHLREALGAVPGFAVVDRERTLQAQRQLDPVGGVRPQSDAIRELAAARQVLAPRLERQGAQWRLVGEIQGAGMPANTLAGPPAGGPAAALGAWLAQPAVHQALGLPDAEVALDLPGDVEALDAFGTGLLAHEAGRLSEALQSLQAATRQEPGYAQAWLALAETALAIGEQDLAYEALEQSRASLGAKAPARLERRLAAELALLEGDPTAAVAAWRGQLADTPDDTFAELGLARARGGGGDFAAAVEGLQALSRRDGNDPRVWYELGKFSILSGDARRAVDEYLVRALVMYKRSGNRFGEGETLNALGIGYGRLGQSADAAEQYRKAAELRAAVGNRRGVATSLRNLANVEAMSGQFDEAAAHLAQARALHVELNDRDGLAAVDNELGLLAEERGNYRDALEAYRSALQTWQQAGDAHGIAQALNNIGFANYQLGAYDDAQVYWRQAADAYQKLGSETGGIRTQQNLGLLAIAQGRWGQARTLLQESLERAQQQQMVEEVAVSHRNLAELELWQGRLEAAIAQAQRAETLFRQRQDQRGLADAGLLHAQALMAAHADQQALQLLDTLQAALAEGSGEQRAIAQLLRAQLAAKAGQRQQAATHLQQARELAASSGVRALQLQIALEQARAGTRVDPSLEDDTTALGHAGLRLAWLEMRMRRALAARDPEDALSTWTEVSELLRRGDYVHAYRLHDLAAQAYAATGDSAASGRARDKAQAGLAALRGALPASLREGFDKATSPPGPGQQPESAR